MQYKTRLKKKHIKKRVWELQLSQFLQESMWLFT